MAANRAQRAIDFEFESTLGKMARVLTGQYGIAVAFSPDGPRVEPGRIVIPPYEVADQRSRDTLVGYLDLLVARSKYSANEELAALGSGTERRLAQVIEDRRVGRLLLENYPGARWYLGRLRAHACQDVARRWHSLSWQDKLVWLVERILWDEAPSATELTQSLSAALHAVERELVRARASRSTRDSILVAQAVTAGLRALSGGGFNNMMFSANPADGYEAQTQNAGFDAVDAPERRRGMTEAEAAAASVPMEASQRVAGSAGMGHAPLATPSAATESYNAAAQEAGRGAGGGPRLSLPLTTEFDVVTDLTGSGDPRDWHALRALARAETAPLKAKLERALKVDELTHWKLEQERGEIDRARLARLAIAPGYRTPFRVRRRTQGRDAAIALLIDRSGSMAGRKIELARLCAAALCDVLTQLQFEVEVLGYSSIESEPMKQLYQRQQALGLDLRAYNRLRERLDLQIYKRFGATDSSGLARLDCGHENPDGEALAWAAARLAEQPAARRILMVLSDGYPSTGDGDPAVLRSDLHARVDAIQQAGIEIIGVGILDDAVQTFYPNSIVVRKLHELPGIAFTALGAMLLDR